MIIDAKNKILGRVATVAAKNALLGETVHIVNCENAIITGNKEKVFSDQLSRKKKGRLRGPSISRMPDRFVRRTVRGMLPYKRPRGMVAFKKIRCYTGIPEKFKDQPKQELAKSDISKLPHFKYVTVKQVCSYLGGKA